MKKANKSNKKTSEKSKQTKNVEEKVRRARAAASKALDLINSSILANEADEPWLAKQIFAFAARTIISTLPEAVIDIINRQSDLFKVELITETCPDCNETTQSINLMYVEV